MTSDCPQQQLYRQPTEVHMNIWEILHTVRTVDPDHISYDFVKAVNDAYPEGERRERLRNAINRHLNSRNNGERNDDTEYEFNWVICEVSNWIYPRSNMESGVGNSEDVSFYGSFMSNNGHRHDYVFANHTYGDSGWVDRDYTYWVEREDCYITDQLYNRAYTTCPECDEVFYTESSNAVYSERNDETYCCSDCCSEAGGYDDDEDEDDDDDYSSSDAIHSYGVRIENVLPMILEPRKRYFGLEVEQEFPGESPRERAGWALDNIAGLDKTTIWKSDGSLSNGAELVTLPQTLDYWQKPNPVQELCENREWRRKARAHDTSTCGLHIHVSRSSIPEPVVAKIIYLMNEPCMREITSLVARRAPSTTYCQASKKRWHSHINDTPRAFYDYNKKCEVKVYPWNRARPVQAIQKRQIEQSGRYTPVNLTRTTLEFRIFRGTLKWTTIQASIEFCEAVIVFCSQMGAGKLNDVEFTAWLKSSVTRKAYPALRDYLESRTVLPRRRQKPDIETVGPIVPDCIEPEVLAEPVNPLAYEGPGEVLPIDGAVRASGGDLRPGVTVHREDFCGAVHGIGFHEDGQHWYVPAGDFVNCGRDTVRIHTRSDGDIEVPLSPGFMWVSSDRRTSLAVMN